jgi:hypothetical protein
MKSLVAGIVLILGLGSLVSPCRAAFVFQDGFETGSFAPYWAVSATNNGRTTLTSEHGPASGASHLVLDDSLSDAIFSVAEATLTLDLTNKKNVVITFKAKSLGNEAHSAPFANFIGTRAYDGLALSLDGGVTWRTVQSLASLSGTWTTYSVGLDAAATALGGTFGQGVLLRFSAYDNAPAPIDGIALDDVSVTADDDQRAVIELPSTVLEGTGPHTGYVMMAFAPATDLTLSLAASPTGQIVLPPTVTVPAGQAYATFEFSVLNDTLVTLSRNVSVTVSAAGVTTTGANLVITDDDIPVVTLALPDTLVEGATPSNNATLSLSRVTNILRVIKFSES